jgi:hypothetical protein
VTYSGADVTLGSKWRHKREGSRIVVVFAFTDDEQSVFVDRNTSRRKQSIKVTTLLRDYRPWR